jgi:hypothetical protein
MISIEVIKSNILKFFSVADNDVTEKTNIIDFDNDIIEIEYISFEGSITKRRIKIIGKEKTNYGDYFIRCYCYLENEEITFRYKNIRKLLINGNEYDKETVVDLSPDMKWKYNIPVKMTYQNINGDVNTHETAINEIIIGGNGGLYINKLSLSNDPVIYRAESIKKLIINNKTIHNPVEYIRNIYYANKPIKNYLDQIKILLYIAKSDNRFTQKEKEILKEYINNYDNSCIADEIIRIGCSEDEYNNIIKNIKEWRQDIKDTFFIYLQRLYDSKKKKSIIEEQQFNVLKKLLNK